MMQQPSTTNDDDRPGGGTNTKKKAPGGTRIPAVVVWATLIVSSRFSFFGCCCTCRQEADYSVPVVAAFSFRPKLPTRNKRAIDRIHDRRNKNKYTVLPQTLPASPVPSSVFVSFSSLKRSRMELQQAQQEDAEASTQNIPPSWQELANLVQSNNAEVSTPPAVAVNGADYASPPDFENTALPILYRERHGWCPYSERVWLALEVLNVDYNTIYIDNIYGRPTWYNGNTPQMTWPDGTTQSESMDLVREINTRYGGGHGLELYPPEREPEVLDTIQQFAHIFPRCRPSSRAAFLFNYNGEPLAKQEFETVLQHTEELLKETSTQGPFFCGDRFTAADIAWTPFLERYAGQLPCLHEGLDPKHSPQLYPNLARWYHAMETHADIPVYACKIRGDASSWRKVLTMAGFGNAGNVPALVSTRMDELSQHDKEPLSKQQQQQQKEQWLRYYFSKSEVATMLPGHEAAMVLIRNREKILKDTLKRNPQKGVLSDDNDELDATLRALAYVLCYEDADAHENEHTHEHEEDADRSLAQTFKEDRRVQALASFLDERMCVPRDMGAISAAYFKRI